MIPFREDAGPAAPRYELVTPRIFARLRSPDNYTTANTAKNQTTAETASCFQLETARRKSNIAENHGTKKPRRLPYGALRGGVRTMPWRISTWSQEDRSSYMAFGLHKDSTGYGQAVEKVARN